MGFGKTMVKIDMMRLCATVVQRLFIVLEMTVSVLHLMIFTAWLALEILGVTLILAGAGAGGWPILGVFTGIAVISALVALVYNAYTTLSVSATPNLPELVATPGETVKPVTVPADNSAKAFVLNLEAAGAV